MAAAFFSLGVGVLSWGAVAPVQASSTYPCEVVAQTPEHTGKVSPSGKSRINYPIDVDCKEGSLRVELRQVRYEEDNGNDDHTGSTSWDFDHGNPLYFGSPGHQRVDSVHNLPNTEGGAEEVYHKVSYRVHNKDGHATDWHTVKSGVRDIRR